MRLLEIEMTSQARCPNDEAMAMTRCKLTRERVEKLYAQSVEAERYCMLRWIRPRSSRSTLMRPAVGRLNRQPDCVLRLRRSGVFHPIPIRFRSSLRPPDR
jgi:hypothetical protein